MPSGQFERCNLNWFYKSRILNETSYPSRTSQNYQRKHQSTQNIHTVETVWNQGKIFQEVRTRE